MQLYNTRDTRRDAILTCNQKLTRVSFIYRMEPTTNTLMKNASVSYSRLHNCCSNRLVVHMCLSYLCSDSYHCCAAYHSEFSVCVFLFLYVFNIFSAIVLYVCLSVLVLWASLPEIKIDDDDDEWKNKKK